MNKSSDFKIKLNLNCEVIRNLEIDDVDIDGEKVMMDIENGKYYALNEVGSKIWELTKDKIKINDIVNVLLSEYEVGEEQCRESTMNFIERLYNDDLIKIA
ncbi:lasso peptide biosynthesis PqqD family chaperone [Clostridium butyricum]|uniref:lasso peptide biosynthesis PqqD family chaperone n=1 Tax=Clostridium butyricum TaxID=1492 RepID=UPI00168BA4C3|nr:lasso peptide biosynthesis PqqD family chaperone [Clostridium butyricum]MDB2151341.1 lasso peptide biosynthesis PqqD family chaperone [Clostridium butyricum]